MAKPWKEVVSSEGYKSLSPEQQAAAQEEYFETVVAPKVDEQDYARVRNDFFSAYPPPVASAPVSTPQQQPADPGWLQSMVSAGNRGFANILGAPVDIANLLGNATANLIGKPEWGGNIPGGSESIRNVLGAVGVDTESFKQGTPNQQFMGRVAQELTEGALPFGLMARLGKTAVTTPTLIKEALYSTGAGTGAAAAQAIDPNDPMGEMIGSLAGGLGTAGLINAAEAVPKLASGVFRNMYPATSGSMEKAVGTRLAENASTAPYVDSNMKRAQELQAQYGFSPNLGQATGDPFMVQQVRGARSKDPALASELHQLGMRNNEIINQTLGGVAPGGDPIALRNALEAEFTGKLHALDALETGARQKAGSALAGITPTTSPQQRGAGVRDIAVADRNTWKSQAKRNFDAIPKGEIIPADNLREVARRVIDESQGDAAIVPGLANEFARKTDDVGAGILGPDGNPIMMEKPKEVTFDYLRQKRTQLNRDIAAERGAPVPNEQKIRNLVILRKGVEDTLDQWASTGGSRSTELYNNARAHYAQGAAKFKQGVTSDLFNRNRLGDPRVPDSAVMDSYFNVGKGGVERAQEFKRVFGNNPDAISAMGDHITSKVALMARGDGTIDPNVIRKFKQNYSEVLKEFPEARRKIDQYLAARKVTDDVMKQTAAQRATAEKEIAKLYLNTDPERVINNIMAGRNPEQKLTQVMRMVQNNPDARNGLRRSFLDWMGQKVTSKSQGLAGESFLMPNQMRAFVNNNRKIMSKLYTQSEMKTIDDVLDMASIVQRDVRDIFPGGSDTAAKMQQGAISMSSLMSRLYSLERGIISKRWFASELGARIGNHVFGAQNEEAARKILREAMVNPNFARSLMAKVGTPEGRKAAKVVNAFLMSSMVNEPTEEQP